MIRSQKRLVILKKYQKAIALIFDTPGIGKTTFPRAFSKMINYIYVWMNTNSSLIDGFEKLVNSDIQLLFSSVNEVTTKDLLVKLQENFLDLFVHVMKKIETHISSTNQFDCKNVSINDYTRDSRNKYTGNDMGKLIDSLNKYGRIVFHLDEIQRWSYEPFERDPQDMNIIEEKNYQKYIIIALTEFISKYREIIFFLSGTDSLFGKVLRVSSKIKKPIEVHLEQTNYYFNFVMLDFWFNLNENLNSDWIEKNISKTLVGVPRSSQYFLNNLNDLNIKKNILMLQEKIFFAL